MTNREWEWRKEMEAAQRERAEVQAELEQARASLAAAVKAKEEATSLMLRVDLERSRAEAESASLRSQLVQAREALRQAYDDVPGWVELARAALSPPSPGSGVEREEETSLCEELGDLITEAGLKLVIKPPAPTDGGGKR